MWIVFLGLNYVSVTEKYPYPNLNRCGDNDETRRGE